MDRIQLKVQLPALPDVPHDIVRRRLVVIVDGQELDDMPVALATDSVQLSIEQDADVQLELRNIDDSGNPSEPAIVTFKAVDTVPPPAPGSFGVVVVGETHEADEVAADEVTPPTPVDTETPEEPADETPAEPADETPEEPADETPAEPADETPEEPADEDDVPPADEPDVVDDEPDTGSGEIGDEEPPEELE